MQKIVINICHGSFGLSQKARDWLSERGIDYSFYTDGRNNPLLVQCVEELGEKANDRYANLKIVEIPDGVEYTVEEYDGWESIHEKHRVWE